MKAPAPSGNFIIFARHFPKGDNKLEKCLFSTLFSFGDRCSFFPKAMYLV